MRHTNEYNNFLYNNIIRTNCRLIYPDKFNWDDMSLYEKYKFKSTYKYSSELAFLYYVAIYTLRYWTRDSYSFFYHSPIVYKDYKIVEGGGYKFLLNQTWSNQYEDYYDY